MTSIQQARSIAVVFDAVETLEGGGFRVRRPFPIRGVSHIDPFMLVDEMAPMVYGPGEAVGAPDHPHRGFETVTYVLDGEMEHKDSVGNQGVLGGGDVQWMTAGAGIVHSEMPSARFQAAGGRMHGFQIWVNLPARDKFVRPRYQDMPSRQIPITFSQDGQVKVKVIAGRGLDAEAVIERRIPIVYLHYTLQPGASVRQPVPLDFNAFVYVIAGSGTVGDDSRLVTTGQIAVFERDGEDIALTAGPEGLDLLLLGGEPIGEPVARYGPFVMNTPEEIHQAIADYRSGKLGSIDF